MKKIIDQKTKKAILLNYLKGISINNIREKYNISKPTVYKYIKKNRRYHKRPKKIEPEIQEDNIKTEENNNFKEETITRLKQKEEKINITEFLTNLEKNEIFKRLSKSEKDFYLAYLSLTIQQPNEDDIVTIKEIIKYATPRQAKNITLFLLSNIPSEITLEDIKIIASRFDLRTKAKGGGDKKIKFRNTGEEKVTIGTEKDIWRIVEEQRKTKRR